MALKGNKVLQIFQNQLGNGTRQIGRYFCIPATLNNALKILGCNQLSQEIIRDEIYRIRGQAIEPDINDQFKNGASFNIAFNLRHLIPNNIIYEKYEDSKDNDIFQTQKAIEALNFIQLYLNNNSPVIISTWNIPWERGIFYPMGYHMWLALAYDDTSNILIYHDPALDTINRIPFSATVQVNINHRLFDMNIGLLGKITHSDYNCLGLMDIS